MYLDLLCFMWQENDCSLPSDLADLCAILDTDRSPIVQRIVDTTMSVSDDGLRITNPRLKIEHDKANDIYQKQVAGGQARAKSMWGKKNPAGRSPNRTAIARTDRSPTPNQNQNQNQKKILGEGTKARHLDFVFLTPDEYSKLKADLNGKAEEMIARLNDYIGSKGVKYKSHYHTILNWWRKDHPEKQEGVWDGISAPRN